MKIVVWIQLNIQQCGTIDSDNSLAPKKQQDIICTNDGIVYWCKYALVS